MACVNSSCVCVLAAPGHRRDLHSFPTRRSSDLGEGGLEQFARDRFARRGGFAARGKLLESILRSEEHTSELRSRQYLVCRLLLEKTKRRLVRVAGAAGGQVFQLTVLGEARGAIRLLHASGRSGRRLGGWHVSILLVCVFSPPPATAEIYTLSLHDALPILAREASNSSRVTGSRAAAASLREANSLSRSSDRKSTRLNSGHANISYAVFCLKKQKDGSFALPVPPVVRSFSLPYLARRAARYAFFMLPAGRVAGLGDGMCQFFLCVCSRRPRPPPRSTLFPYTTLFRSWRGRPRTVRA